MQRTYRPRRKDEETVEEMPETEKKDLGDIDTLLDEIEDVLDSDDQQEIERIRFKDKLRSINFIIHRASDPCEQYRRWRERMLHQGYVPCAPGTPGAVAYDGPPCVDC